MAEHEELPTTVLNDMPEIRPRPFSSHRKSRVWDVFGKPVPRSEIVFLCQMIVIYVVIGVSLVSLTRDKEPADKQLWIALLSSCLGYLLPNPRIEPPLTPPAL
jgi:hypothetical protein